MPLEFRDLGLSRSPYISCAAGSTSRGATSGERCDSGSSTSFA